MKAIFAALISASVLGAPMAFAAQPHMQTTTKTTCRENPRMTVCKETTVKHKKNGETKKVVKKSYKRGHRLDRHDYRVASRDEWRRHHLNAPPRGQEWVVVDGRYMLINSSTRLIISIFGN
ncbi:RcnB family protein [Rhizobium sp. PAMB 3174]